MTVQDFTLRLLVAFALGTGIGLERQWRQRQAGLRTGALVAIGSCLFVMLPSLLPNLRDQTQLAAYVITGIGFLAGGVIFKERQTITGLNTAATIWCTAAVGVLCGYAFFAESVIGAAAVVSAHLVLRPLARLVNRQPLESSDVVLSFEIRVRCREDVEEHMRSAMITAVKTNGMMLYAVYSEDVEGTHRVDVIADVTVPARAQSRLEQIVSRLGIESGVVAVSWKAVPTTEEEREMLPEA